MATEILRPAGGGGSVAKTLLPRWRHFFGLIGGYFTSKDWPLAWILLALLLVLTFGGVQSAVGLVEWQKTLFDAIGARRYDQLFGIMVQWAYLTAAVVAFRLAGTFFQGLLQIRWRTWLTNDYTRRYLENAKVYEIEQRGIADNPDQRIAEDINLLLAPSGGILALTFIYLQVLLGLYSYTKLLWEQSRPLVFSLGETKFSIPGDFVIYTYAYGIASFCIIYFIGKPLIRRTMFLQKAEADFRFALTNIRRAAEQIAFYRAAANEWRRMVERFARVRNSYLKLLYARMGFEGSSATLAAVQDIIPYLAALPRYFAGTMTLGDVQMSKQGFQSLQGSLSVFTISYAQVAALVATVNRLHLLDEEIARPRDGAIDMAVRGTIPATAATLQVALPTGEPLLDLDHWHVQVGERWAIQGPSGVGKSTLLRAMAGLWPYGSGAISLGEQRAMFVPQQLYTPDGTLRELLAFPTSAQAIRDDAARDALSKVRLSHLVDLLDTHRSWGRELSPGEQQRIAFARILLHRPEVLFLDEATSSLDPDNAAAMYALLGAELPGLTLVSIVHNPQLAALHDRQLDIRDGRGTVLAA